MGSLSCNAVVRSSPSQLGKVMSVARVLTTPRNTSVRRLQYELQYDKVTGGQFESGGAGFDLLGTRGISHARPSQPSQPLRHTQVWITRPLPVLAAYRPRLVRSSAVCEGAPRLLGAICPDVSQSCMPFFPHRAAAAFCADTRRSSGVIAAARARPPFNPPLRPSATAAGSFPSSAGGCSFVAISVMRLARLFKSVGIRERLGMIPLSHGLSSLQWTNKTGTLSPVFPLFLGNDVPSNEG